VPTFLEVRQEFGKHSRRLFVYADGGFTFHLLPKSSGNIWLTENTKYKKGNYYDLGVGLKSIFRNNAAFLVSIGYNYKEIKKEVTNLGCPFYGPCIKSADRYQYSMPRIAIRAGYQF
jgi:hypothetical protein